MQKTYQKNLIAIHQKYIAYFPSYNTITGGVTSSILFGRLEYWFDRTKGEPFFKYLKPNDKSREGDTWIDETGLSEDEFRTAFNRIGKAWKSKTEFQNAKDKFDGKMYCSYTDKIEHKTYYIRNHESINSNLAELGNPISGNGECPFPETDIPKTDTKQEKTQEKTTKKVETKVSTPSKNIEFIETKKTEAKEPKQIPPYFQEVITKMVNHKNYLNRIIGEYWIFKGRIFATKEQLEPEYKRELRPAKALSGYEIEKIRDTFKKVNQYASILEFNWTLETVGKMISHNEAEWQKILKPKNVQDQKAKHYKEQSQFFKSINLSKYDK